jgi:hypothetical protein
LRTATLALLLCALATARASATDLRAQTDVITLKNGDHITGRIIVQEFGYLQLSSVHSGSVSIEWSAVRGIESQYGFTVERFGGLHYAGTIRTSPDGQNLIVGSGPTAVTIPMQEVARIEPYERSFWNRINGSASLGYNFTKASSVSQGSFGLDAYYRDVDLAASLTANANVTKDSTGTVTDQEQVASSVFFLRPSPNFWGLLGTVERNRDLGVNLRLVAGSALGRTLYQSTSAHVSGIAGLAVDEEVAAESGGARRTSLEGVLGAEWREFKLSYPKVSLSSALLIFPSITESPRVRGTFNIALTLKLTDRFALKLSSYANYDSHPPQAGADTLDYGVVTSIAYAFGPVLR